MNSTESKQRALQAAKETLALCRKVGKNALTASALNTAAQIYTMVGRINDAQACADEAVPLLEESCDKPSAGYALILSAQAHIMGRRNLKAKEKLQKAISLFTLLEDEKGKNTAENILDYLIEAT